MNQLTAILTAGFFGIVGAFTPCALGINAVFLGYITGKPRWQRLREWLLFALARAVLLTVLGLAFGLLGQLVGGFIRGYREIIAYGLILLGALFVVSRFRPFPLPYLSLAPFAVGQERNYRSSTSGALALGAIFGLDIPACTSPLVLALLAEQYAPATANKMLSALRRVVKEAWKLGYVSAEIYQRVASVENVKGETLPTGRELSAGEIASLMNACQNDPGPAGVRDASMIALLYSWGLRRAEIVALDFSNYDSDTRELVIRGKRSKERKAHLVEGAADAMADWLIIRDLEPGPLFWPINKGGAMRNDRLTTQAVYKMLRKRARQAGVKDFSPHDLRRTFVSDLLEAGADIAIVSKMAGHANVQTTARYDRRPEKAKRKAANRLHVPYQRRKSACEPEGAEAADGSIEGQISQQGA